MKTYALVMAVFLALCGWGSPASTMWHPVNKDAVKGRSCPYCIKLEQLEKVLKGKHLEELKRVRVKHMAICHGQKGKKK